MPLSRSIAFVVRNKACFIGTFWSFGNQLWKRAVDLLYTFSKPDSMNGFGTNNVFLISGSLDVGFIATNVKSSQ